MIQEICSYKYDYVAIESQTKKNLKHIGFTYKTIKN